MNLYITFYPDQLMKLPSVAAFLFTVWRLPSVGDDRLVSSLRIISTAIRSGYYKDLVSSRDHRGASAGRRRAEHQTKKRAPLVYPASTSRSLESGARTPADVTTRRQGAANMLRALVGREYEAEAEATEIGQLDWGGARGVAGHKEAGWADGGGQLMTAVARRRGVVQLNILVLCCSTRAGRRGWGGG
ncbi:hypothetical protein FIBSPDRAFT_872874 [Athelia psychrophila]|uniref:Uncharacterized protein n=1 Tax=Athelia psychrophila TaxID=1759441 RepID=A0A165Z469_9AGAM|nr:hypothetical protein FIBSPDRAFT_872874 [Fibularhizoctonia sp. CBS 109695]